MPSLTQAAPSDDGSAVRVGVGDCSHRMHVVGRMWDRSEGRVDCDQPLRAVCREECGHVETWRCESYGCGPCGETKRRRLTQLVDQGSALHLGNGMVGYFLTLTAPGTKAGHLRVYQGKRPLSRPVCGCESHGLTQGEWNGQESACWNRLRTSLSSDRGIIFAGAVETQQRGLLHRHVMLFSSTVLTHEEVQRLALLAGYGCVLDLEPVRSSGKAARYISKYVTKSSVERAQVPWERERLNKETGELYVGKWPTYRLWSSSRKWGVTMKEIRQTQSAQAAARALYLRELVALLADDIAAAAPAGPSSGSDSDPP